MVFWKLSFHSILSNLLSTKPLPPSKCNSCSDWQDRLPVSSIVHAQTNTILKVMRASGIPHHNCCPNYFWNKLCGSVAIFTNLHIFSYLERSTRSCVDEPQCNKQFLAMLTKMEHLFFFFHILQNQFSISHVPHMMHEPQDNLCGSAQTSIIWGWSWLCTTNVCTSLFTSIQVQPGCFFILLSFLCQFNIPTDMHVASSSIDVW